jgi:hypothetical protein
MHRERSHPLGAARIRARRCGGTQGRPGPGHKVLVPGSTDRLLSLRCSATIGGRLISWNSARQTLRELSRSSRYHPTTFDANSGRGISSGSPAIRMRKGCSGPSLATRSFIARSETVGTDRSDESGKGGAAGRLNSDAAIERARALVPPIATGEGSGGWWYGGEPLGGTWKQPGFFHGDPVSGVRGVRAGGPRVIKSGSGLRGPPLALGEGP